MSSKNKGMTLDERALLVKLSINKWSASKTDKQVGDEVAAAKNAQSGSGYYRKVLISKNSLNQINKIASSARMAHYTLTLPWNDDGSRIITTEAYQTYSKIMREKRIGMQEAVEEFLENYNEYVKAAEKDLGKLFKEEDYPSVEAIKGKFHFEIEPIPIPASKDFRAKVSNKEAAAIAKDIENRTEERLKVAMNDVWERIANVTKKMAKQLEEYKPPEGAHATEGRIYTPTIDNIRELTEILPTLNIRNDPKLSKIHKDIQDHLCLYDADELREDARARNKTAKKAKSIYDKVSAYMA